MELSDAKNLVNYQNFYTQRVEKLRAEYGKYLLGQTCDKPEFYEWLNQLRDSGELEQYTFKFFDGWSSHYPPPQNFKKN